MKSSISQSWQLECAINSSNDLKLNQQNLLNQITDCEKIDYNFAKFFNKPVEVVFHGYFIKKELEICKTKRKIFAIKPNCHNVTTESYCWAFCLTNCQPLINIITKFRDCRK